MDGKDGNGFKPIFSSLDAISTKITKKLIIGCSFSKHYIRYSPHSLLGTFCSQLKVDSSKTLTHSNKIVVT